MEIAVQPTKANEIRALKKANPRMTRYQIAHKLGIRAREVDVALGRGDRRRVKSVAQ